ncbi:hypothetical protein HJFPF1_13499 [Paramyrothecium foliicola]|nr:hypothetical protein HJFPF1_13499 [Paramyrothecium foliicola]
MEAAQQQAPQNNNEKETGRNTTTKRRRTATGTDGSPVPARSASSNGLCTNDPSHGRSTQHDTEIGADDVHIDADLEAVKSSTCPFEFYNSIQRIPHSQNPDLLVADITLFVQEGQMRKNFGCAMEIGIVPERVTFYARQLFGVELEVKDGVRYMRHPNGGKIEPDPALKLRGCHRNTIQLSFGMDIANGFSTSPICQREAPYRLDVTDGVSMTINNREKDGGKIAVFLGEWYAFAFKRNFLMR